MSNNWYDAIGSGYAQWEATMRYTGWPQVLKGTGYALAGTLCGLRAFECRGDGGDAGAWLLVAGLLALIGANAVLRVDLLAVSLLREVARTDGWYERRRTLQVVALATIAGVGLLALGARRARAHAVGSCCAIASLGAGILAGIAVLRAVSLHATDLALDARIAGIATGRALELAGLGLTAAGALRSPRTA